MQNIKEKFYTEEDYYALPENIRAELIDGQFYNMAAPNRIHQKLVHFFDKKIGNYIDSKGGLCEVYPAPFAVKLFNDKKTIVEPDISVICDNSKLTDAGCAGAPDWVVEVVSPSTSSHDYISKLNLYANAGVREYWIVNPMQKSIYVYYFEKINFKSISYSFQDKIKVNIFEDLYMDFTELDL